MPLPTCECVTGMPIGEQLGYIYCALVQILNNGGGGSVNINDVEGVSDFWKATLGGTPTADQVFGTDGAGVFTTFPITDIGVQFLALAAPGADTFVTVDSGNVVNTLPASNSAQLLAGGPVFTGTQNPVTEIIVANGIVTGAS